MTHDELRDYIDKFDAAGMVNEPAVNALRSVVELHKPYEHEVVSYVFCMGCTIDLDLAPPYPCETIEAIEKELG
jgi:Pyruvate/2-oxoacid:ferredoxin oxidoreductase delta subunit